MSKDTQTKDIPFLSGAFFIIIALDYLASTFKALGMGENFYFLLNFFLFFLVIFSFVFLRKGLNNTSKHPYKTFGAILLSLATTISSYYGHYTLLSSLLLGSSVFAGWYMYYGFDIKLDNYKKVDRSTHRITKLLLEASKDIDDIKSYAKELKSTYISSLMYKMADAFDNIVKHISNEPQDYNMARKYLVSYLNELKSISKIFVKLDEHERTKMIEDEFTEILISSTKKLKQEYKKLLDDDILELDIKLSVMKKRLKEGN